MTVAGAIKKDEQKRGDLHDFADLPFLCLFTQSPHVSTPQAG